MPKYCPGDSILFILMAPVLFIRKLDSHRTILSGSFASCNFFLRPSAHTVSKAFSASMKRLTVLPPPGLLNHVKTCSASLNIWWIQDFLPLNPAWKLFRRFWCTMYLVILPTIILSISFPRVGGGNTNDNYDRKYIAYILKPFTITHASCRQKERVLLCKKLWKVENVRITAPFVYVGVSYKASPLYMIEP